MSETCGIDGCERPKHLKGWCRAHYMRHYRGKNMLAPLRKVQPERGCSVDGCERAHRAMGFCNPHYLRSRQGLSLDTPLREKAVRWVKRGDWFQDPAGYLCRSRRVNGASRVVYQHREVMEGVLGRPLMDDETVHHKNGQRDDNRPENLELWSSAQPAGQRVEDKVAFALEILARYEAQALAA